MDAPEWNEKCVYPMGASVSYLGRKWLPLKPEEAGNVPQEDSEFWQLVDEE